MTRSNLRGATLLILLPILLTHAVPCLGGTDLPLGPAPGRSSFAITDFMIGYPAGPAEGPYRKLDISTELGWLFSLDDDFHLGPAFHFGTWLNGGWHSRWGFLARARIDLDDRFSLDLAPGLIAWDSPFPDGLAGYTLGASVIMDDWIGLTARLDVSEAHPEGSDTVLRLGIGIGSMPGLCLTAASATAGAIAAWLAGMD